MKRAFENLSGPGLLALPAARTDARGAPRADTQRPRARPRSGDPA